MPDRYTLINSQRQFNMVYKQKKLYITVAYAIFSDTEYKKLFSHFNKAVIKQIYSLNSGSNTGGISNINLHRS